MRAGIVAVALAAGLSVSCSRSNNLLIGRVEAVVGTHRIAITDCYRISVPPPQRLDDGTDRYMPCRDADVRVRGEELTVNGRAYGRLAAGDGVVVDHGVVSIIGAGERR